MPAIMLKEEIHGHMSSLEDALAKITNIRSNLATNSHQTAYEIRRTISRHLEAVRRREVWLLQQVQMLEGTKDQNLSQQAHRISNIVAALRAYDGCLDGESPGVEAKVQETLDSLKQLDLEPMENPHLSFEADMAGLRDVMHKFGSIDDSKANMTRDLEYYEDEEHHLCEEPMVPRSSSPPPSSQWLFQHGNVEVPSVTDLTFPPFQALFDADEWLLGSSAKAPLHQYLKSTEVEGSIEVLSLPGSCWSELGDSNPICPPTEASTLFHEVSEQPREAWLKDEHDSNLTTRFEAMEYFTNLSDNIETWLLKAEVKKRSDSCCGGSSMKCSPPPVPLEIEELDLMTCTTTTNSPIAKYHNIQMTSDVRNWLKPQHEKKQKDGDDEKDVDYQEEAVAQGINQLCQANETCKTFDDCLCDNSCLDKDEGTMGVISESVRTWLVEPKSPEVISELHKAPIFQYFSMITGAEKSEWLTRNANDESNVVDMPVNTVEFPPFGTSTSVNQWLVTPSFSVPTLSVMQCPFQQYFSSVKSTESSEWIKSSHNDVSEPAGRITSSQYKPKSEISQWLSTVETAPAPVEENEWLLPNKTNIQPFKSDISELFEHLNDVKPEYNWSIAPRPVEIKTSPKPYSSESPIETKSTENVFKHLDVVQLEYSWSVTPIVESKPKDDKPIPKASELPESDDMEVDWLLVGDMCKEKRIMGESYVDNRVESIAPDAVKNRMALGEWLMDAQQSNVY